MNPKHMRKIRYKAKRILLEWFKHLVKKETIDVIRDCMTSDEYHGYLKGNVLKYVSRYKFKGEPLEDLQKANWYLNRLIKEVNNGAS